MSSNLRVIAVRAGAAAALSLCSGLTALADPPPVYYISMRSIQGESAASFVTVVTDATAERGTAIAGCDGRTYYATAGDAAAVAAARANGEVVQLHRGQQGDPPQASRIRCIIDASG